MEPPGRSILRACLCHTIVVQSQMGFSSAKRAPRIVRQARGEDYSVCPHHWDPETAVHVFRPTVDGTRWYVKAYFVDDEDGGAVFVSIHR